MKKDSEISRMFQYAGNRHWLTILGMILAGLSTVLSMVPFICIWFVVRDMLRAMVAGDNEQRGGRIYPRHSGRKGVPADRLFIQEFSCGD